MSEHREPPALLRRWEALRGTVQFAIAWPPLVALLWWIHVALLNQPVIFRGLFYGFFWGTTLALALVYASRMEAHKRRMQKLQGDVAEPPPAD